MSAYVRTTTVDSAPSGDSVKQAILDLDTDLTGHVAAYNTHDTATTSVHGFTGTKTGSGAMVGATSPTLVTPVLGVATATSINKVALTAPATSCTLTIANGKTLTCSNTLTFAGTDATTITFPSTSCTVARTDAGNSFTGNQVITGAVTASQRMVYITGTASHSGNNYCYGQHISITDYVVASGVTNTAGLYGNVISSYISTTSYQGTIAENIGVYAKVGINACGTGGTITDVYGGHFTVSNNDANGTITNGYGIYIDNSATTGTMTHRYGLAIAASAGNGITNCGIKVGKITGTSIFNVGLYIDSVSGNSNSFSIYTTTGEARFGDVVNTIEHYEVDGTQVVSNRVVDARIDDTVNTSTWDSTTAGVLDAIRDACITHGLIAAS